METYLNLDGQECIIVNNNDGTIWSGLKSAYDEMTAQSTLLSDSVDLAEAEKPKK